MIRALCGSIGNGDPQLIQPCLEGAAEVSESAASARKLCAPVAGSHSDLHQSVPEAGRRRARADAGRSHYGHDRRRRRLQRIASTLEPAGSAVARRKGCRRRWAATQDRGCGLALVAAAWSHGGKADDIVNADQESGFKRELAAGLGLTSRWFV